MTELDILSKIQSIFREELEEPELVVTPTSSAGTIEKWDSINNLVLLNKIEEEFKVEFDIDFIFEAENVQDIIEFVSKNS